MLTVFKRNTISYKNGNTPQSGGETQGERGRGKQQSIFKPHTIAMFARTLFRSPIVNILKTTTVKPTFTSTLARFQSTYKINPESIVSKHSSSTPKLYFTAEHEWIALHEDGAAFIGITNYAADALGDATFIDLPADRIDEEIPTGEVISSIESVKSASDVYSPLSGSIVGVNEALDESPELINKDPMGEGWIVKLQVDDASNVEGLMEVEEYEKFIESSEH